jgi:hypothetical protein
VHALRNRLDQSSPLFGVLLMGLMDWVILGTALAHVWWSIGTTHVELVDGLRHVATALRDAVKGGGGAGSTAGEGVVLGAEDKGYAGLTYTYTKAMATRDAAIAAVSIVVTLALLPLTGWF